MDENNINNNELNKDSAEDTEEQRISKPEEEKQPKKRDWTKLGAIFTAIGVVVAIIALINGQPNKPSPVILESKPPPKPKLIIKFELKPPHLVQEMVGTDTKQYPVYHFRCDIINNSGEATAKNCEIKLTEIEHFDEKKGKYLRQDDFEIQRLRYPIKMPFDISPQSSVRAVFGQIGHQDFQKTEKQKKLHSGNIDEPQFLFLVSEYFRRLKYNLSKGKHRFKISVFCTNSPPVHQKFEIEWFEVGKNDWPRDYKELAKYITIKKMD